MPIYEYQCAGCGRVVEKWQKISEEPLTDCPTCGGALSKLISNCSFRLKGSGWYVTDYSGSRSQCTASGTGEGGKPEASLESSPAAETAKTETPAPPKKFT